jgi:hypothetical protein
MYRTISFNNQERIENLAGRVGSQIEADSISFEFIQRFYLSKGQRIHRR